MNRDLRSRWLYQTGDQGQLDMTSLNSSLIARLTDNKHELSIKATEFVNSTRLHNCCRGKPR